MTISLGSWLGLVVGLILALLTLPVVRRAARRDHDPWIGRVLFWALVLKLVAAPLQIYVVNHFYHGVADANTYSKAGAELAPHFRHGDFAFQGKVVGNGFVKIVTGAIYAITGANKLVGFLVFSWLAFLGLYFFYRAFRTALPDADYRRYAKLLFFLPSLVFWSSSISKEALIIFGLGLAMWGAAKLLREEHGGFTLMALGLTPVAMMRPHVALIAFGAIGIGYLRRRSTSASAFKPFARIGGIAVLVLAGGLLIHSNTSFFNIKSLNSESVGHVLDTNQKNLGAEGGNVDQEGFSSSEKSGSLSPGAFPKSVVTILFRPFPWEAHSFTASAAALEGAFLVLLLVAGRRRFAAAIRATRREPYLLVALAYSLVFIYLFASLPNLGVIARERIQLLPIFVVLLAWPAPPALGRLDRMRARRTRPARTALARTR
jgi:hypothetical protein